jgi:hypothetical protein
MNIGNLANPKVFFSLHDDEIKLAIKSCECRILGKEYDAALAMRCCWPRDKIWLVMPCWRYLTLAKIKRLRCRKIRSISPAEQRHRSAMSR